jgi:hypothetical protein
MIEERFMDAIKIVSRTMEGKQIEWAVVGSTNLGLHGMEVTPHDLDIAVRSDRLGEVRSLFAAYNPSPVTKLESVVNDAWEVRLAIGGVEVQIFGERADGIYVSKLLEGKLERLRARDVEVSCFTLEAEAQAYSGTGRQEKAEAIRAFVKGTQKPRG